MTYQARPLIAKAGVSIQEHRNMIQYDENRRAIQLTFNFIDPGTGQTVYSVTRPSFGAAAKAFQRDALPVGRTLTEYRCLTDEELEDLGPRCP